MRIPVVLFSPWKFYQQNWQVIVKTTSLITIPGIIVGLLGGADNSTTAAYISVAGLILNVVTIWLVAQLFAGKKPSLKQSFYRGTSNLVVFFLVTLVLSLQALPLAAGLWVATVSVGSSGIPETILLWVVAIALSVPTFIWLQRYILAIFPAVLDQTEPLAALRTSKQLARGNARKIYSRLGIVLLTALTIAGLPAILLIVLGNSLGNEIFIEVLEPVVQTFVNIIAVPWSVIAMYQLYQELK